jgi:hypothetical protein
VTTSVPPTSPASIRSIPHPPAAAPAAGGWGIDGSRRVYSVGCSGVAAGGAVEAAAWSDCFWWAALLSSALAAPVERRSGPAVPCATAARRSCGPWCPCAGGRVMAASAVVVLEGVVAGDRDGVVACRAGWRCSGTEERRLPGRKGSPPSPSFRRKSGGFRRRSGLLDGDEAKAQKDLFVIFFVSGLFCKNLG